MKEFEITIRVKNNNLVQRRRELGLTIAQMAEAVGINMCSYGGLETMRESPRTKKGNWTLRVLALANFHMVAPEELFPQAVEEVTTPVVTRTVGIDDLAPLLTSHQYKCLQSPLEHHSKEEMEALLKEALSALSDGEREVVTKCFGLEEEEKTYAEIGKEHGLSAERVRQIRAKALRKLRHPSVSQDLRDFLD